VSPGLFHAIGKGTLLVEVQEPSDTTFRVYDFRRVGLDGKPRALHIEEALLVGRFDAMPSPRVTPTSLGDGHELLVDAPGYRMERLSVARGAPRALALSGETAVVALVTRGHLSLQSRAGEVRLSALDTAVIPASTGLVEVRAIEDGAEVV